MAVLSKIPRTNVKMEDIRDTLNAHGGTVSNILGSFFSEENFNIWAKQKPISYPSEFSNNDGAGDGNYGFTPATATSIASLKSLYSQELNGWVFNPPTGGASAPYRLGDFRNYNPNARESTFGITPETITTTLTARIYEPIIEASDRSTLLLSDFDVIKNGYFGVALFYKDNGNLVFYQTAATKGLLEVTIDTGFYKTSYIAMPFVSSVPYTLNETFKQGTFYSIPLGGLLEVNATSVADTYKLRVRGTKLDSIIRYTIYSDETAVTRSDVWVDCRFQSSAQGSTLLDGERRSGKYSLAPGAMQSGSFSLSYPLRAYRLDLYCGTLFLRSVVPMESSID